MSFHFQPMDEHSAQTVVSWRYEPPYDCYNFAPADIAEIIPFFSDPGNAYYKITDDHGDLVAFCCFGFDARVPGGNYNQDALDLGLGVRPDLTGQSRGATFVAALIDFARHTFTAHILRVTVASFNGRALRVWQQAGFEETQRFLRSRDGKPFVVLTREEAPA